MDHPSSRPKVSVCVLTYNYASYIRNCLTSILDQVTNFPFEVIVADDCSADGTADIIREFQAKYPGRLKAILHTDNLGPCGNYLSAHERAVGEYIAHLDGDDYMLAGKLQAQVDFLDAHPECSIVKHRMLHLRPSTGEFFEDGLAKVVGNGRWFTLTDVLRTGSLGTHSSKMYRRASGRGGMKWPPLFLDWLTDVTDLALGRLYIMPEILGVRRVGIGISSDAVFKTRDILAANIEYLVQYAPEYKARAGALALRLLISDIARKRVPTAAVRKAVGATATIPGVYHFLAAICLSNQFRKSLC